MNETHLACRPAKRVWPARKQALLRRQVQERVRARLLPDPTIERIVLFGSLATLERVCATVPPAAVF